MHSLCGCESVEERLAPRAVVMPFAQGPLGEVIFLESERDLRGMGMGMGRGW